MSGRGRTILAIVLVVILAALGYFFLIRPRSNELADVEDQITAEESEQATLQAELARRQELREQAPQLEAELASLNQLVPDRDEVPNFIFLVQEAANSSGVGFVQITPELPKPPPEGSAVAEIRTTIGARGGYFAVQDFVRRLYTLDRALRMDIITITQETDEEVAAERGRTVMTSTVRIFFEPEAGINPAAVGTTTTTTTPTTTTSPSPSPSPSP
jgi:Tfp pilus assembly protein PilO